MRGKLGGSAMCICGQGCGSTEACGEYAILLRDLTTATAKIAALEAKLAAAERLFVKCTRFDIYLGGYGDHYLYKQHDGRWYEADSEQYFDTPLEAFESLQKENTDA